MPTIWTFPVSGAEIGGWGGLLWMEPLRTGQPATGKKIEN